MSALARARVVLAIAVALWCALVMAQWAAGPRDGVVVEFARLSSFETGIGPALGPLLFERGPGSGRALALLLLLAPATIVLATTLALRAGVGRITVIAVALALGLLSFLELPQLSNDVFLYRLAGEMLAEDGVNPYLQAPASHFPAAELRGVPWAQQTSPYGPAALGLFAGAFELGGSGFGSLWTLRAILALPWLLALAVALRSGVGAGLLLATSPLLLLEVVQSGHLDGWIGLLLASTFWLAGRSAPGRRDRALLVLALAAALSLKLSAVVVVGALFVHLVRHPDWGWARGASALAGAFGLTALAWAPLWAGVATFDGLKSESAKVLQSLYQILEVAPDTAALIAAFASGFAILAGMVLVRRGWSPATASIAALVLQATIGRTFLQPWYFVPALMLAGLAWTEAREPRSGAERALVDPSVWGIASVGLVFGGYAIVFATRSLSATVQTANVIAMLVPGLAAFLWRARLRA